MTDQKCSTPDCPGEISAAMHNYLIFDLLDDDGASTGSEIQSGASVYAHICECGELIDIGIEDQELDANVARMRTAIEEAVQSLNILECSPVLRGISEELKRSLE